MAIGKYQTGVRGERAAISFVVGRVMRKYDIGDTFGAVAWTHVLKIMEELLRSDIKQEH